MPSAYDVRGASAYVQTTTTSTVSTVSAPGSAKGFLLSCDGSNLRFTLDGSSPSSSAGHLIAASAAPVLVPVGKTIKFCSVNTTVTTSNVTWLF